MAMLVEFSMYPMDKGESVGESVAHCLDVIDKSGVPYRLNPMGTVIEGEWDELMRVIKDCFQEMSRGCNRIACTVKLDWRRGATGRLTGKVESVERRLGRDLCQ